ncbi:MAG: peptidoglycan bridge formation glycyltransferase FemA/FemB family protein [Abitibacteriaceae bacterium]|nr:peptidoglycan bridge formation glycyltransferase FemA/FemB family protein [Abditibacteriaceae bacterium]
MRASYALVNYLVEYLQQHGITEFDFGGLDPRSSAAAGVNQFKRGFGGELIEYLGEWEWASQSWLRYALNLAVWYRGSQL